MSKLNFFNNLLNLNPSSVFEFEPELIKIVPLMTSNTTPEPWVASASSVNPDFREVYSIFDENINTCWGSPYSKVVNMPQWVNIQCDTKYIITEFIMDTKIANAANAGVCSPKDFVIFGYNTGDDESNFAQLFSITNVPIAKTSGSLASRRFQWTIDYFFTPQKAFNNFRFKVLASHPYTGPSKIAANCVTWIANWTLYGYKLKKRI